MLGDDLLIHYDAASAMFFVSVASKPKRTMTSTMLACANALIDIWRWRSFGSEHHKLQQITETCYTLKEECL